eukprot:gene12146-14212_t
MVAEMEAVMLECAEFTDASRWKMERFLSPHVWWKKRLLEEMNSSITLSRLELNERNTSAINAPGAVLTGQIVDVHTGLTVGTFRFIDPYDAAAKFEGARWVKQGATSSNEEPCPFTGDLVGFFNFSLLPLDISDEAFKQHRPMVVELLRTLTFQTRGTVTRLDTLANARSVIRESCKLSSVLGKYGLNDGDVLLDTDLNSAYIVSLIETIQKALDAKGVGYNVVDGGAKVQYTDQTSHNPIRYTGHLPKEAMTHQVPLWIYNAVILSNRLWGKKLED